MDVRLSAEQVALRDSAAQVVDRLGPRAVAELDDAGRAARLDAAVVASGWRELRAEGDGGLPLASAVEVAVVAEELGRGLADAAFVGPTLAAELRRLAGAAPGDGTETVVLGAGLTGPALAPGGVPPSGALAPDAAGATSALVLVPADGGCSLAVLALEGAQPGLDLTRPGGRWGAGARAVPLDASTRLLDPDDVARVQSLGLSTACADLVGIMRGASVLATDYARERRQFGAPIGSFQAVQHLLADAVVLMEGSRSIALHAAWAVDALAPADALGAASAAKAYCARAARVVCETAVQVHGGIGNTWECLAHVFLRRALLSGDMLGGVGDSLERVLAAHHVEGARQVRDVEANGGPGGARGLR